MKIALDNVHRLDTIVRIRVQVRLGSTCFFIMFYYTEGAISCQLTHSLEESETAVVFKFFWKANYLKDGARNFVEDTAYFYCHYLLNRQRMIGITISAHNSFSLFNDLHICRQLLPIKLN